MKNKRGVALITLLILMGLSGLALNLTATPGDKTITAKLLRANPTHGYIKLPTITAQSITHSGDFFYFNSMGFDPQAGTNMTSLATTSSSVTVGLSHAGTIRIYTTRGEPATVTGGPYSYAAGTTTVTATGLTAGLAWSTPASVVFNFYPAFALLSVALIVMGAASILIAFRGGDATAVVVTMLITAVVGIFGVVILAAISGAMP